jgi:hypothetical protein
LWGGESIYNQGAIQNAKQISEIYPNWKMVVFHSQKTSKKILNELVSLDCLCIKADESFYGMFWRFFAHDLADADYIIFRDVDSRLSLREKFAVEEWIASGKSAHCIRDHPLHRIPARCAYPSFLGGMWGIKKSSYPSLISEIKKSPLSKCFAGENKNSRALYGFDQEFLQNIYNYFNNKNDIFIHDEFGDGNKIDYPRDNYAFIGERMTVNNLPTCSDRNYIKAWYNENK